MIKEVLDSDISLWDAIEKLHNMNHHSNDKLVSLTLGSIEFDDRGYELVLHLLTANTSDEIKVWLKDNCYSVVLYDHGVDCFLQERDNIEDAIKCVDEYAMGDIDDPYTQMKTNKIGYKLKNI